MISEEQPSKKKNEAPSSISKKPKSIQNCLLIVGASGSGKTALFYSLFTGEFRYTVSSIEENLSGKDEAIKLGEEIERKVQTVDIPGHFNFRERIQELLESSAGIILVVDSKDKTKHSEAAEILYDIINNIGVLDAKTPILVACNKQDQQFARKSNQIQAELEKEIEELRKVRKATQDDQDIGQELTTKVGYLEQLKKRFSFKDAVLPPISFTDVSVTKGDIKGVQKFIAENF